ncbi:hypothetical protein GGS26DRAFT_590315 [Hypomontagnella submonticulosa]|nr:hypothetical protein GGS26DRAFT_590315 [Hypomontagnella submonticulosa]
MRSIPDPDNVRYKIIYAVEPNTLEPAAAAKFFTCEGSGNGPRTPADTILEEFNVVYYEIWHNAVGLFLREYHATHSGQMPYIEAIARARLDYGSQVSKANYDISVAALKTRGVPNYRDEITKRKDDKGIF